MALPLSRTLVSPASSLLAARRSFALAPALRQPSPSTVRQGGSGGHHDHGHHVPPEGDINHGRSAYGFQSHDRHEHFTFPGEEQAPYQHAKARAEGDQWAEWKSPGMRTFFLMTIGLYTYVQLLPSRESMKRSHTPSAARPSFESTAPLGPDDARPWWYRVADYWVPGDEERRQAKADWVGREVDKAHQSSVFKQHIPQKTVRREDFFEPYPKSDPGSGEVVDYRTVKYKTVIDDERQLGIDRSKWDAQKQG